MLIACQASAAPPPASTPTTTKTPDEIKQWASGAVADSTRTGMSVGKPNTLVCSATSQSKNAASLDIYFEQPVIPSSADLHTLAELPANATIQLLDPGGNAHDVKFSMEQTDSECPFLYHVTFSGYAEPAAGIRISSTGDFLENWNAVDAVELLGIPSGSQLDFSMILPTPVPPTPTRVPSPTPTPAPIGQRELRDRTDDYTDRYQLHVVYALFKDHKDLERDLDGSIAGSIALANNWFKEQTGGSTLRFDTYTGELDVTFVQFDITAREALEKYRADYNLNHVRYNLSIEDYYMDYIIGELVKRDFYQKGKYYIIYLEEKHPNYCGFSLHSSFPGVFFLGTRDCGYGRLGLDAYAWSTEFVMLHEVLHGIGFTPECAPHNVKDNPHHVSDSSIDLMYPYAGAGQQYVLDAGHDDYFKHGIVGCPDLANSAFLEPLPEHPEVPKGWPRDYLLDQ